MRLLDRIDDLCRWAGAVASMALLAMTLIVTFEVASRYLFGAPTIWAWDVNVQLMLLLLMLGLAETYRRDAHVRVDVITAQLSRRGRAWLEVLFAPVFFLVVGVVVWTGWGYVDQSFARGQRASTVFAPLLWPVKLMIPLGGALLALQGLARLAREIAVLTGREGGGA